MEEVAGTAKLVDPAAVGASALTATLPRSDLEEALQDEAGADLFLEIARIQNGERNDRRIRVTWEREDLEKILQGSSGDSVSITFDGDELARMLDPDFEAHGLKEHLAVIAVALGGAAALAGGAAAMTSSDGGGAPTPAAVTGMVTDNSAGAPGAVTGFVTDASTGGVAAPAAADTGGTSFVTDNTAGQPGAISGLTTDASTSGDTGSVTSFITDTGSDATRTPVEATGDGGFSIPGDALGGVALAGGLALLITGAAVAGRSRKGGAQPA